MRAVVPFPVFSEYQSIEQVNAQFSRRFWIAFLSSEHGLHGILRYLAEDGGGQLSP